MANMKVLVTGGAGFIGANLVRVLLSSGCHVTVLDDLSAGCLAYLKGLPIEFIQGDVLDKDLVVDAVLSHDWIAHLAAQTGVPGSLVRPYQDCEVNVIGTLNLLEACRKALETGSRTRRIVFASSNAPLGRQIPPAVEDKVPLPISPYGASKLAGEAYCLAYHGSWGLGAVVLRFGNVYGPYSAHKDSAVAKFFKDIRGNGHLTIHGDGEQTRDFVYVADLCRAVLLALESDVAGEVFQIATGIETNIRALAQMSQEAAGRVVGVRDGPPRHGDIRENYSVISKALEMLGWEPTVGLHVGLRKTWEWFDHWV